MKYIVLIGDGMADYPLANKGGKTPLQISYTPYMDSLAQKGTLGLVKTIPDGIEPGSDVANLNVLGYDPICFYSGRAPIEAASIGVELCEQDVAFRCNLVTLHEQDGSLYMGDYSAGHITTDDAAFIMDAIKNRFDSEDFTFYSGVSYRHLMVWKKGEYRMITIPPHDITGKKVDEFLPQGQGSSMLRDLMDRIYDILPLLEINKKKVSKGELSANAIWLWGQGRPMRIPQFSEKYGLSGSVISAVDLIKGLGILAGLNSINVPGATGYLDTNYEGKAKAALSALEIVDFVYLHVEAPDEASHKGNFGEKVRAIEDFDAKVVKIIVERMNDKFDKYRIMVLPDHPTPLSIKTHTSDPVPFVIYSVKDRDRPKNQSIGYNENDAKETGLYIERGWELMDRFIKG